MSSIAEAVALTAPSFTGQLLHPTDPAYDERRRVHNGLIDNRLMIDLSPMKGIHVDAVARTVRAQGGVLWKELNRETQLHRLATTGGVVGSTGIAGLTLGGGVGWLMPKHGLALDNLRAADLVMADGRVVRAGADENPDLW